LKHCIRLNHESRRKGKPGRAALIVIIAIGSGRPLRPPVPPFVARGRFSGPIDALSSVFQGTIYATTGNRWLPQGSAPRLAVGILVKSDIPFTSYDFWAYLTSGFVLLFVVDHVVGTQLLIRPSWSLVESFVAIACAYAMGHVIAGFASALWERLLLRRWTGIPTRILMGDAVGPPWFRAIYPSYYEPLPSETLAIINDKAKAAGITKPGEGLFWAAFAAARADKTAQSRLGDFLNQYGLCRNVSFTATLCAFILAWSGFVAGHSDDRWWAAFAAFLGLAMYLRYMKFYRLYAIEVLTTYAHAK
jgi:hypothetical protein